jgi:predicted ATPase
MRIESIHIKNFRGISEAVDIHLKPITLFVGPNSSGKSTVIHALAALSQTAKIANDTRPLVLDDEYASVHLGRFIEVIHSKSYADSICLGLKLKDVLMRDYLDKQSKPAPTEVAVEFEFKSTTRTQKISIENAKVRAGANTYSIKKKLSKYTVEHDQTQTVAVCSLRSGFTIEERDFLSRRDGEGHLKFWPLVVAQRMVNDLLRKTSYLGPFRMPPQRQYPTRGASPAEVGAQGEFTATLLANEIMQSQSRVHINQIATWMALLGIGKKLDVSRLASSHLFDVNVTLNDGSSFPLADLGYGLSQALPVLAQCSFAPEHSTLLFEQPELHLHSLAVRPLAEVFIDAAKKRNLTIVAETHSPELVGQFQKELRKGNLKLEDIVVYRVSRQDGRTKVNPIQIDPEDYDIYERWEAGLSVPPLAGGNSGQSAT